MRCDIDKLRREADAVRLIGTIAATLQCLLGAVGTKYASDYFTLLATKMDELKGLIQ